MQVYTRVANPFMPQGTGNATNASNTSTNPFYAPGEIGCAFYDPTTGRAHARMKLDSGATSATSTGVVAAGQLAFWHDRVQNIVTNHKPACDVGPTGAINRIAGVFPCAVDAGNICDIVIQAKGMNVASDGSGAAGVVAIADTTASTARVIGAASATTAPISQVVGVLVGAPANSLVAVDVSLGFIA